MGKCEHPECARKAVCKGYCDKHYRRLRKNGSIYDSGTRKVAEGDEIQRFHQKYEKHPNGCWIWTAGTGLNNKGVAYSKHSLDNGKTMSGHRFSYDRFVEPILPGKYICHRCDTPLCVNPDHLFMSDHHGNMKDMVNKGRSWKGRGEKANSSVLTNSQAQEIRSISGVSQAQIASRYCVSQATVSRIKRGETYV